MSSSVKSNVHGVSRQNSNDRKTSSPKLIKKASVSRMENSPKIQSPRLGNIATLHGSPQLVSVSGSLTDASVYEFIQQCSTSLPGQFGTPPGKWPLPEGSEDFQKVMHEFQDEDFTHKRHYCVPDDTSAKHGSPSTTRSRHLSSEHVGLATRPPHPTAHSRKGVLPKRISTGSMPGPLESPHTGRKQAGLLSHAALQGHSQVTEFRRRLVKQDDIFNFSSEDEEDSVDRVHSRHHPISRTVSHS